MAMPGLGPVEDSGRQVGGGVKVFLPPPRDRFGPTEEGSTLGVRVGPNNPGSTPRGWVWGRAWGLGGGGGPLLGPKLFGFAPKMEEPPPSGCQLGLTPHGHQIQ